MNVFFLPVLSLFAPAVQDLLREHVVVTLFLTMLVGAGGNAGNQSAIKVCPPDENDLRCMQD